MRDHLRMTPAHMITDGFKQKLLGSIGSNEDILSHWRSLSADADEEDAQTLLKMVIVSQPYLVTLPIVTFNHGIAINYLVTFYHGIAIVT